MPVLYDNGPCGIVNTTTQLKTDMHTQLPASNELTTIMQFPVTPKETDDGSEPTPGEEICTSWLILNHNDDYVLDEFVCRWTPCDVVFDTYSAV